MTSVAKSVLLVLLMTAMAPLPACQSKSSTDTTAASASAAPIGIAECAACKMVVREQPAPRGQAVHRDGTRVHLCSIGDLVQYLASPSPHGNATAVFVEALEVNFDPKGSDTKERPWVAAESASYVVGVDRERIMGPAVLSYRERGEAEAAAKAHGGKLRTWAELRQFVLEKK
ncbi:MAG TPA: nitrous oxide reductase accessory protein NosL [Polyangiaceae bacterium]|nr:nitrous oxide reductase accessory protein NosL [Polyangiaceae bacterium]